MPYRCCVPNCKGNYKNGPKVHVFGFPSDKDLSLKWINTIPRKNFQPSETSKVCEAHFCDEDIISVTSYYDDKTGRNIFAKLDRPRLKPGAVPSLFPGCPTYFSTTKKYRETPNERRCRIENNHLEQALNESINLADELKSKRFIPNFESFLEALKDSKISSFWTRITKQNMMVFVHIEFKNDPYIESSVVIDDNLTLNAYFRRICLRNCNGKTLPLTLIDLNDLHLILDELEAEKTPNDMQKNKLSIAADLLDSESENATLSFLQEQLKLLAVPKQRFRYSAQLLIFSSLLYSISPHGYKFLRHSGNIILPHPVTIRKLCASLKASPSLEQQEEKFLKYAAEKYSFLKKNDKTVILLLDEIHLKPFFDYTNGNILSMSYNGEDAATSAHVFMVSSLCSSYKDVVHIVPIKAVTSEMLHSLTKRVIIGLEKIGFFVIGVVSDNNSINRKALSFFTIPPQNSIVYPHPVSPQRPLFYIIDPVHILKCIRNNWINQKNVGQCMFFPNFDYFPEKIEIETASFQTLKKLHELEYSDLLKFGKGLSLKSLYPSNLERQDVKLVLQVFNEYVVTALNELGAKHNLSHYASTASYINIILQWWKIINVKNHKKGIRKRDLFMEPLTLNKNDVCREYLDKILKWLDVWKKSGCSTGILTHETHLAITQSTHAILELSTYCIEELGMNFFLPGKIQTDPLEERFGKYRQLAGCQYNVSVRQIFESEAKLRMQNTLDLVLKSNKYGIINIKRFNFSDKETEKDDNLTNSSSSKIPEIFQNILVNDSDIKECIYQIPVFGYLAGYCIYKLIKELKCTDCSQGLEIESDETNPAHKYISLTDRGALKYPHNDVVIIVMLKYIVLQKLISAEYENDFLHTKNQRYLLKHLTTSQLTEELQHLDVCVNGHSIEMIIGKIIHMTSNTLLKNYCHKKNDIKRSDTARKRKITTLQGSKIIKTLSK